MSWGELTETINDMLGRLDEAPTRSSGRSR